MGSKQEIKVLKWRRSGAFFLTYYSFDKYI